MEDLYVRGKKVGRISNGVYFTYRDTDKHYFRKFMGFGISEYVLNELLNQDIKKIIIKTDKEEEHLFTVLDYLQGITFTYKNDKQRIVRLK